MSLKVKVYIIVYFVFSAIWLTETEKSELWNMEIWSYMAAGKYDNVEILGIYWMFLCSFKITVLIFLFVIKN